MAWKKNYKDSKKALVEHILGITQNNSDKSTAQERQAIMVYMDSGFKSLSPCKTDWLLN